MNAADKKALVRNTVLAMLGGDLPTVESNVADDIRWIMAPSLSQTHPPARSKAEVLKRVGGSKPMFPEGLKTEVRGAYCDGDTVIVEFANKGPTANGKVYENEYCVVFELNGEGKIREIREYQDTLRVHQTFLS